MKSNNQMITQLASFKDEFSVLSIDDSDGTNVMMYKNSRKEINFDKIKKTTFPSFNSCDTLMLNSSDIVFVEFKNGCLEFTKVSNDKHKEDHRKCANRNIKLELYLKITESALILSHLSDATFSDIQSKVSFILVYNEAKNPQVKMKMHVGKLAGNQTWLEIKSRYSKTLLKNVQLMTVQEFDKFVSSF